MYKILFSTLIFVSYIGLGYGQDIAGTGWKIYEADGTKKIVLFEKEGTFGYMSTESSYNESKIYNDVDETWELDGDKIILLFNDGYRIFSGTINKERDYMSGTSINKKGLVKEWYGTLIKFQKITTKNPFSR
mgnify:CR=1 FL=1|tara:strand:+ start:213 stop:608 length:396 start_codon:yes stop_codon:yes gene_type:complete